MFNANDNKSAKKIFEAVAIAGLSCAVVEMIKWGVKELRDYVSPPKEDEKEDDKDEETKPSKKTKKK